MGVLIKPSDLYYKYYHKKESRDLPKFTGKPDPSPFDRDDLYEVLPMFTAVMDHFDCVDQDVLHKLEDLMIYNLPQSIKSREEVFDCLVASIEQLMEL
jgi:hypothetical protein